MTFDPRRAEPGQEFSTVDQYGHEHSIKADDDGVLRPKDARDAELADLFSLPVARKVIQAEKAKKEGDA